MSIRLLVCDLDNTLYDWVTFFVKAFYSMVDEAVILTKCDKEKLLDDLRVIHRKHRDLEHPFALLETKTMRDAFSGQTIGQIAEELDPAFRAFNVGRKKSLRLYPGVHEGLKGLMKQQVRLIAHTESNLFAAVDRLDRLDLGESFDRVYCRVRAKSTHPNPQARTGWFERYSLEKFCELTDKQRKPDAKVLLEICDREGIAAAEAAYVGDSIARDIAMARNAGVYAIWAEYGTRHDPEDYARLVRVTHWTAEDVIREERLKRESENIAPDAILRNSFMEIVQVLEGLK